MIGSLRGELSEIVELGDCVSEIVVDVGGVGYRLAVGTRTAVDLGPLHTSVRLAVHTHVRDSAITLYGFASPGERHCFEILVATHGIGPALALAILGVHRPESLARIVASEDEAALTMVPGVGRKTAARLLVELASRLEDLVAPGSITPAEAGSGRANHSEVGEALGALGYGSDEVRATLASLPLEGEVEDLLRVALQQIGRTR